MWGLGLYIYVYVYIYILILFLSEPIPRCRRHFLSSEIFVFLSSEIFVKPMPRRPQARFFFFVDRHTLLPKMRLL